MKAARRGEKTVGGARFLRFVAVLLVPIWLPLTGCDRVDRAARDACIAVLPALEEGDGPILVLSARMVDHAATGVRLAWRSGVGRDAHDHETTCVFTEDRTAPGGGGLVGVRTEQGALPLARLFVLRRFWLTDPELRAKGLARVALAPDLR